MKKNTKPCLTPEESAFINDNRHKMSVAEISMAGNISTWKIRNYLAYYGLSVLSGRGREINSSHEDGEYFNINEFRGETACLAYKSY